jgi:hypothetical protein
MGERVTEPTNAELKEDIADLRRDMQQLTDAVSGLISVWETGTGLVAFVRATARLVSYMSIICGFLYGGWKLLKASLVGH